MLEFTRRGLRLLTREDGQDLVEYALLIALVAFGVVAGMRSLATGVSSEFNRVSATLASYIS
jgi:pilus assembly protein Flp/PilA